MYRRILTAALAAGAIGVAAPGVASAAPDELKPPEVGAAAFDCAAGDFCLWEHRDAKGGRYFHDGNDGNLNNDYFRAGVTVGNHASSAKNNGVPAAYDDVVWYDETWFNARLNCLPRGWVSNFGGGQSNDRVESFAWVTSC